MSLQRHEFRDANPRVSLLFNGGFMALREQVKTELWSEVRE